MQRNESFEQNYDDISSHMRRTDSISSLSVDSRISVPPNIINTAILTLSGDSNKNSFTAKQKQPHDDLRWSCENQSSPNDREKCCSSTLPLSGVEQNYPVDGAISVDDVNMLLQAEQKKIELKRKAFEIANISVMQKNSFVQKDTLMSTTVSKPELNEEMELETLSTQPKMDSNEGSLGVDGDGIYPIHRACALYADNPSLISMILSMCPSTAKVKLELRKPKEDVQRNTEDKIKCKVCLVENEKGDEILDKFKSSPVKLWEGLYPLHLALSSKKVVLDTVKILVEKAPEILCKCDKYGRTPLHVAIRYHVKAPIILYLINKEKRATVLKDQRQNTPLHYACTYFRYYSDSLLVIDAILKSNKSALYIKNYDGNIPHRLAIMFSAHDEVVDYLHANYDFGIEEEIF